MALKNNSGRSAVPQLLEPLERRDLEIRRMSYHVLVQIEPTAGEVVLGVGPEVGVIRPGEGQVSPRRTDRLGAAGLSAPTDRPPRAPPSYSHPNER